MSETGAFVPTISHEVRIDRSIEDLAELLGHHPDDWLSRFASIASNAAETEALRLHGGPRGNDARNVNVVVGDPGLDDESALDRLSIPLRWETSGYRWFFRVFEGRIALFGLPAGSCIVRLEGSYAGRPGGDRSEQRLAAEAGAATLLRLMREAAEEQARSQA
jgi:hypothetical protein